MVQDTGAAQGPGGIRPLGLPKPIQVRADERGWPVAVKRGRRWVPVTVEGHWRVDDEWWRGEGVARVYFETLLPDDLRCVLFLDLSTNWWYRQ